MKEDIDKQPVFKPGGIVFYGCTSGALNHSLFIKRIPPSHSGVPSACFTVGLATTRRAGDLGHILPNDESDITVNVIKCWFACTALVISRTL